MASAAALVPVDSLRLDLGNPRAPEELFRDENEAIEYLVANADVAELVQSIGNSGWLDFEPLIATEQPGGLYTVLEGNRRLCALRILAQPGLQQKYSVAAPELVHPGATPESVTVQVVADRSEARDFIGFKHVNGAFKWDALAKAHFASTWLADEPDVDVSVIAKRLGDGHLTVVRLVNGYRVLLQAESFGFDRKAIDKKSFYFSYLYTAISLPSVRDYLGLPAPGKGLLPEDPVDPDHASELSTLMSWLYGQNSTRSVIDSQNPNLGQLARVLANELATSALVATGRLADAYEIVEDKAARFTDSLYGLSRDAKLVLGRTGDYSGDPEGFELAVSLERTVRNIRVAMAAEIRPEGSLRGG